MVSSVKNDSADLVVPVDDDTHKRLRSFHGKNIYFTFSALMIFFSEPVSETVNMEEIPRAQS